jgi:hypothetical protein
MSNEKATEAVTKVSNERLEDLIKEAINNKMDADGSLVKFQEFDVDIRKELAQPIFVDIDVFGMAGDTTKDEFAVTGKDGKVSVIKGGGSFSVKLDDDTVVKFVFDSIVNLNATDYRITYRIA